MRVAHCVPIFSELTQTFVYELVCNFCAYESGVEPRVLTWCRKNSAERPFNPVDVVPAPTSREILRLRFARVLPDPLERTWCPPTGFERSIADCLRQTRTELVHVHFGPTAVLVGRACRLAGVPMLITFRGRDASAKLRKRHWRRLYRRTLAHAAAVTCVSEDLRRQLKAVLPPGLDAQVVHAGKCPQKLQYHPRPSPRGRLVSVGRLIEKKGHADAIRAVARAQQDGSDVTLRIIGEGPMRADLENAIKCCGVEDAVTLTGALSYDQVIRHLHDADFLIAANRVASNGDCEGVPNVVKEAQLIGLPVIATHHGGIPQAVPASLHDRLVEEGDVNALAARVAEMNALSADKLETIGRVGRDHVLAHFDPLSEVRVYRALYASILAPRGSVPNRMA